MRRARDTNGKLCHRLDATGPQRFSSCRWSAGCRACAEVLTLIAFGCG